MSPRHSKRSFGGRYPDECPRRRSQSQAFQRVTCILDRTELVAHIADLGRIATPEGVQTLEQLTIGGVKQWVSVRGLHRENPLMVFIHGGPGSPAMPMSWAFQRPWEDFFTVVQWDQRGVGKNWAHGNHGVPNHTLSLEQFVADAEDLIAYLRRTFNKDKVVVAGWSYGTIIGIELIQRRPEWVSAYVGIGQCAWPSSDTASYIYRRVLELARSRGNGVALAELEAIQPYPNPDGPSHIDNVLTVMKWVRFYNGGWYGVPDGRLLLGLHSMAPEYSADDCLDLEASSMWFLRQVAENDGIHSGRASTFNSAPAFRVPIVFMMGRYDLQTPYVKAKEYFSQLSAPYKRFVTFPRAAHFPMFEQPGAFLNSLVNDVLPLTEGIASFAELADASN
jgi:proline iminopeptidase